MFVEKAFTFDEMGEYRQAEPYQQNTRRAQRPLRVKASNDGMLAAWRAYPGGQTRCWWRNRPGKRHNRS
jgi:hypothetical protein